MAMDVLIWGLHKEGKQIELYMFISFLVDNILMLISIPFSSYNSKNKSSIFVTPVTGNLTSYPSHTYLGLVAPTTHCIVYYSSHVTLTTDSALHHEKMYFS